METGQLNDIKNILKSLIVSSPENLTVDQLNKDFQNFEGKYIPFKRFGFSTLEDFLRSIPDALIVMGTGKTAMVRPMGFEKSKHIRSLIINQKVPRSKPKKDTKSQYRNWGNGPHNKNFLATPVPRRPRGQQLSPFQISVRNISTKKLGIMDVPADRSQSMPHTEEIEAKKISQNLKDLSPEEIEKQEKRLNTTFYVAAFSPPVSEYSAFRKENKVDSKLITKEYVFHMRQSIKKALLVLRNKQMQCGVRYPLKHTGGKNKDERHGVADPRNKDEFEVNQLKDLAQGGHGEVNNFDSAVPDFALIQLQDLPQLGQGRFTNLNAAVPQRALSDDNSTKVVGPFGEEIPLLQMPDNIGVGTSVGIFTTEVKSPLKFWFNFYKESDQDLFSLMAEMLDFYDSLEDDDLRIPIACLVDGQVCVVKYLDIWHRATIIAAPVGSKIKVFMVDYGTVAAVKINKTKFLLSSFADLPAQALRGCLSHLKPCQPDYSPAAINHFASLVDNKMLFAKITEIDKKNMIFYMILCDTNGNNILNINEELIEKSYAVYNKNWQEILKSEIYEWSAQP